jgi:hypothetical protein
MDDAVRRAHAAFRRWAVRIPPARVALCVVVVWTALTVDAAVSVVRGDDGAWVFVLHVVLLVGFFRWWKDERGRKQAGSE